MKRDHDALTDRDRELAQVVASKLRVCSLDLVARWGWPRAKNSRELARRALRQRECAGYVTLVRQVVTPPPRLQAPVLHWRPGNSPPDFARLAYRLRSRRTLPLREELLALATQKAASSFGGAPGQIKQHQLTHDLLLGEAFLHSPPKVQHDWVGEDCYAEDRRGLKLPDALAINPLTNRAYVAIEAVNTYTTRHLRSFHFDYAVSEQMEYYLW